MQHQRTHHQHRQILITAAIAIVLTGRSIMCRHHGGRGRGVGYGDGSLFPRSDEVGSC